MCQDQSMQSSLDCGAVHSENRVDQHEECRIPNYLGNSATVQLTLCFAVVVEVYKHQYKNRRNS